MHLMLEEDDNKFSANLVSSTCQFCGESFGRPNDLSLHFEEKNSDEIGKEA